MDIRFIKPQDLLALSIAICAWRFDKVKWLSRSQSLMNTQHIGKKDEEVTKLRNQKHWQKMELDRDQIIHQHA
jgi:hypothetical protein